MNSSETSSEETDQQEEEEVQDDSGGTKRSYECTFCRRGFTNAQALGGHMNIHRKDRAKAKQLQVGTANSSSSQFPILNKFPSNEESLLASSPPFLSNHPTSYYSIFEGQRNYSMYFQPPPPPNRRHPPPYAFPYEYLNPRSQSLDMNQELLGANLSLQIGPSHEENNEVRRRIQNDEVDLELRLGHDPY